jgi:hypothetical protein
MDEAVRRYIDGIRPGSRALFDRVHQLIMDEHPDATVSMSYQILAYQVGRRRLYVGAWKHGISLYGWQAGRDGGLTARHPELISGKATLRLRHDTADAIPDSELRELARSALSP